MNFPTETMGRVKKQGEQKSNLRIAEDFSE